jgi:hypothetical protein
VTALLAIKAIDVKGVIRGKPTMHVSGDEAVKSFKNV